METRQKPRKRDKFEGTLSLLSRAKAQDHLYVTTAAISLFSAPVTWNKKRNIQIEKNEAKTVTLPGSGAKFFSESESVLKRYKHQS